MKDRIVMDLGEMLAHWTGKNKEFVDWFLWECPDVSQENLEIFKSLTEDGDEERRDLELFALALFVGNGKRYEIIPNYAHIEWNGKLNGDFTLGRIEDEH